MGRAWRRCRWTLLLMVVSAALAVLVAVHVFPDRSPNHDETAYLSQAEALRDGRITLPASTHAPYFLPFLSSVDDDTVVFKYQPTWPTLLAAVRATTGSFLPALALSAAATTGAVSWFLWELTRRRRTALAATSLFAVSPFVIIESGTYLAYLPSVALLSAAGAALLRARATSASGWYVASGALFGLAAFHRIFDAALFALPFLAWFLMTAWHDERSRRVRLGQVAGGAAPFLVLLTIYNWAVAGSPFRMPFTVGAPVDSFGFGRRASFGSGAAGIDYDVGTAFSAFGEFASSLNNWILGGFVCVALAAIAVVVQRRARGVVLAAGIVVTFPVGYFFWWGTGNAVRFELEDLLGPFYWLPALPALCALVVVGGAWLWERQRVVFAALAVAAVAIVGVSFAPTYRSVDEAAAAETNVARLQGGVPGGTVLLTPPQFGPDRYANTVISPGLDSDRLVAFLPDHPAARFDLIDRFPDRELYELYRTRPWDDFFVPHTLAVRSTGEIDATVWNVEIEVSNPGQASNAIAYFRVGDTRVEVPIANLGDNPERVQFEVTSGPRTEVIGPSAISIEEGTAVSVAAGIAVGEGPAIEDLDWFELRWDLVAEDGSLRIQDPPAQWQRVTFPGVTFGEADVREFVRVVE